MVQADFYLKEWYLFRKKFRVSEDIFNLNSKNGLWLCSSKVSALTLSLLIQIGIAMSEIVEDLNLWRRRRNLYDWRRSIRTVWGKSKWCFWKQTNNFLWVEYSPAALTKSVQDENASVSCWSSKFPTNGDCSWTQLVETMQLQSSMTFYNFFFFFWQRHSPTKPAI